MTAAHPAPEAPRRITIPAWAWAAAAALLLFAAYTTWQAQHAARELAGLDHQAQQEEQRSRALDSEQQRYQQALSIVAASATRQILLKPARAAAPAVTAYWNPQKGLALTGDKMPVVSPGRTLQLWIVPRAGALVSVGIFRPNTSGQILLVMPPNAAMAAAKALAITDEPAGGSAQPTASPQWTGPLT